MVRLRNCGRGSWDLSVSQMLTPAPGVRSNSNSKSSPIQPTAIKESAEWKTETRNVLQRIFDIAEHEREERMVVGRKVCKEREKVKVSGAVVHQRSGSGSSSNGKVT